MGSEEGVLLEPKAVDAVPARPGRQLTLPLRIVVLAVVFVGLVPASGYLISGVFTYAPYALVATVLIFRMPRQPIGWLLLGIGWSYAVASVAVPATAQQLADGSASWWAWFVAWLAGAVVGRSGFLLLFILTVIFPSGQFPGGRWGRASRWAAVGGVAISVLTLFSPTISVTPSGASQTLDVANPLAILPDAVFWQWAAPLWLYLVVLFAAGAFSLIVRLRHSAGTERQQLRWLVAVLAYIVCGVAAGLVAEALFPDLAESWVIWIPVIIGLPLVPIAIGIAVLRYRLYEIDVLVNRTVLYGVATLAIAVAFGVGNVVAQRLIESWSGQRSDLVAGIVGAGAALAFAPLIRLIRPVVDRVLPSRAVLALLFTDIVGSTVKIVALGDERWRRLLGRYRAAMRQELGSFGGHEVNTAGDSFFATFATPSAALDCARAMRDAAHELDLETRTGLHCGEVELRGEQVSGLEVHAAARVMAEADAGQIVVSAALREALPEAAPFADLGDRELKGVPGARQLYRLGEGATG